MECASNILTQMTGYIDTTSLAQPRVAAHQECKSRLRPGFMFSRVGVRQLRKTRACYLAVFAGWIRVLVMISTASSRTPGSQCGLSGKAQSVSSAPSFFSHSHQISGPLLHSLCTGNHQYPSLFARYPKLPQASATTTVFI